MIRRLIVALSLFGWAGSTAHSAGTGTAATFVYQRMIERYPYPGLKELSGREFKFLVDAAKLPKEPGQAFTELWRRVKVASEKAGVTVTPLPGKKGDAALNLDTAVKEYFDTPTQELWKLGYILRVTAKAKKGEGNRKVTVKAMHTDALRTLATPLTVDGSEAVTESEGNVGLGPNGQLTEYVEKGSTWSVRVEQLGSFSLGDFGKFMPELLKLGLPATTRLVGTKVYAVSAKLGQIVFSGSGPMPAAMEGWSKTAGGEIFLFDLSYRSEGSYYQHTAAHEAGEVFMREVLLGDLQDLALPDAGKWGGSKVRVLLNRSLGK